MSSSEDRVQKITEMSRSELKSMLHHYECIDLDAQQRIIIRNRQSTAIGPAYPAVKIIHLPPQPTIDSFAPPHIPLWHQVSRGPAIEAPYLNQALIITPPPRIDPLTLVNKPDSGQRLFDYIENHYPDKQSLIQLGKTQKNKLDLIQYIRSMDDVAQEDALNKALNPATRLYFFFAVPRSFLSNTSPSRGSFKILADLQKALLERKEKSSPETYRPGSSMDIFEPRPSFNIAWE